MTSAKQGTEALRIMDEAAAQLSKAGFDNMSISEAFFAYQPRNAPHRAWSSHRCRALARAHCHRYSSALRRSSRRGARHAHKKLRILIRHAINIGWLKYDPSLGIKRPKIKKIRSWTDAEIEQFKQRWPLGTKQRAAFHLFLNLGQRRSDVVRMARSHITPEGRIRIKQPKTERELLIPLHRDTVAALDAYKMKHIVIINTEYGKPFTVDGFSGWMRDAISEAGLSLDCKPHGLRKAAGRMKPFGRAIRLRRADSRASSPAKRK